MSVVHAVNVIENAVTWAIFVGAAAFELFAFIDAALRPAHGFVNAGKLTKPAWLLILALSVITCIAFRSPIGILGLLGLLASSVYMADVRPALAVRRGRR